MILDSSAIIAVLRYEDGFEMLADKIDKAEKLGLGTPNFIETAMVVDGQKNPLASRGLDKFMATFNVDLIAFTPSHAQIAREAFRDFGKGSGHAAKLNFGDCMAYAVAKLAVEPLLYVGNDFPHTDIEAA